MSAARWVTLPCGRDPEHLLTIVAEGVEPSAALHEATCPWCRAAIGELEALWHPVRHWTGRTVDLPEHFLIGVVDRVRRLVQSPRHIAAAGSLGATTVTSWVLGLLASDATGRVPGVASLTGTARWPSRNLGRRRSVRYGADGVDIDEVGAAGVAVTLGFIADYSPIEGSSLAELANEVRRNVIRSIAEQTTIEVTEVDIFIDDLEIPPVPTIAEQQ